MTLRFRVQAYNRLDGTVQNTKEFLGASYGVTYPTRSAADAAALHLSIAGIPAVTYCSYPVKAPSTMGA